MINYNLKIKDKKRLAKWLEDELSCFIVIMNGAYNDYQIAQNNTERLQAIIYGNKEYGRYEQLIEQSSEAYFDYIGYMKNDIIFNQARKAKNNIDLINEDFKKRIMNNDK